MWDASLWFRGVLGVIEGTPLGIEGIEVEWRTVVPSVAVTALVTDFLKRFPGDAVAVAYVGFTLLEVIETRPERERLVRVRDKTCVATVAIMTFETDACKLMGVKPPHGTVDCLAYPGVRCRERHEQTHYAGRL